MKRFYVKAITAVCPYRDKRSKAPATVQGYGVYDTAGGIENEHATYLADWKRNGDRALRVALYLANQTRDDLNDGIA